ncbi:MAG TPA: tetratricopeptide repeat protein [Bryobacteraceae bacterium]|nr:tetratricopeptide repeat protein [Bryobacteraceae bacterium]
MFSEMLIALLISASVASDAHLRGVALYKQQKYADAIAALQLAAKQEAPATADYRESMLLIGQSYFMLSKSALAIPWLEKVPDVTEANYMLGYAYLQSADREKSEAAFARLFGLQPATARAHVVAAEMMLKKEFEDQAIIEIGNALALDPNVPKAHYLLGEIAIVKGDIDGAISDLKKEIAIDPSFSMAWYRLGDAYTRREHWDLAIPNLERAVWLNPDFSGPFILLGKCYFKQHNFSNAEGILQRALVLDPRNHEALYLLGQTQIALGRPEDGKATLNTLKNLQK